MKNKFKCPQCNGTGILKITVNQTGKLTRLMEINCITCDGTGYITAAQLAHHKELENLWCRCKVPGEAEYYECGNAHGYNCSKCGNILQTG